MEAYLPGDVVLVYQKKRSVLGRLIAWGTRSRGEGKTRITHVAIVRERSSDQDVKAIGAEWRVRQRDVDEWPRRRCIRYKNITLDQRKAIAQHMIDSMGRKYGWWQYVTFVIDEKLMGGENIFRRLTRSVKRPMCSTLAGWVYKWHVDMDFVVNGKVKPWYTLTPDDWDDMTRGSDDWQVTEDTVG